MKHIPSYQEFLHESLDITNIEFVDVSKVSADARSGLDNELSNYKLSGFECNFEDDHGNPCTPDRGKKLFLYGVEELSGRKQDEVAGILKKYHVLT